MTLSLYNVLRSGFEGSTTSLLDFVHPKLKIDAKRDYNKKDPIEFTELWFWIAPERLITEEEVHAAIGLFHPPSEYQAGGLTYYTETKQREKCLPLERIPSFYAANREKLRSIADEPPGATLNDDILDGPVKVPWHKWGSIYAAFEKPEKNDDPKLGHTWNSVVLYRDGMKLRIAKPANYLYAISPALTEVLDKLQTKSDAECDLAIRNVMPVIAKHEEITSEADVFKRMFAAPQPVIKREEIEAIANYIETMICSDPVTLDYVIESPF